MTTTPLRKVAFLDTNVLHFVDLYLRRAKDHCLFPFGGDVAAAKKHLSATIENKRLKSSLNKGLNVVAHLQSTNIHVEYSAVSELEMMEGRARGKAIEKAATEGIPGRIWSRFVDHEVGDRLRDTDLTAIRTAVEGLGPLLDEAGIDAAAGRADRTRDVLELAWDVMELVYMSVIDSVIYAGALVAEADQVISDDGYLKKTVNRLRTETSLREARRRLESRIAAVLSREPGSNIALPDAIGIPGGGR